MSAFLRKWSASANDSLLAPSTPASASSSTSLGSTSTSPPGSVDPLAPCVPDWPDQLPNERYYGLENVSFIQSNHLFLPQLKSDLKTMTRILTAIIRY
jgi:hypothetical protein